MQARIKWRDSTACVLDTCPSVLRSTKKPVKQWKKDVVAPLRAVVMNQMMFAAKAQPRREPAANMNSPVNFLDGDHIHRESDEDSRADSQFEQHFCQERDDQTIEHKSRENQRRRAA